VLSTTKERAPIEGDQIGGVESLRMDNGRRNRSNFTNIGLYFRRNCLMFVDLAWAVSHWIRRRYRGKTPLEKKSHRNSEEGGGLSGWVV